MTKSRPSIPDCPISLDRLKDPVILDCTCRGTVSRQSFATWKIHQVDEGSTERAPCPNCGRPLQSLKVVPNVPLREILESLGLSDEEEDDEGATVTDTGNASLSPLVAPIRAVATEDTPQEQQSDQACWKDTKASARKFPRPLQQADQSSWKDTKARARMFPRPLQLADPVAVEPEVQKLRLAAPMEEEEEEEEMMITLGGDYKTKKGQQSISKKGLQLAAAVAPPEDAVLVSTPLSPSCSVAKGGSTSPLINTRKARTESAGDEESGRREMYEEENSHSNNHHVSLNNTSVGDVTPPLEEEESTEQTNAGLSTSKRWIQIGIAVFILVAIIGVITRVLTASKSDTTTSAVAPHTPAPSTTAPTLAPLPAPVSPTSQCNAKRLGSDLDGEAAGDLFGSSVAISSEGNRLAVGATANDGNGDMSGHVRVFDWSGSTWIQLGSNLDGEASGDLFGWSVSLSSDGNRLAVGATENDGNGNDAGHVRVFEWSGSTWIQLGSDLDGEAADDFFGHSVSLSSDGNRLAVSAYGNDGNGLVAGHVRVFDWSGSTWIQLGSNLDGEASGDLFGWSVSLSSDGNRLAVAATANDGNGDMSGHVRVFDWSASTWIQLGLDFDGESSGDRFGWSVSLSSDGNRLAVGATKNDGNGNDAGHVRVFDWTGSTWIQLGPDLDGDAAVDEFGHSVSLSSDGNRLAVGATKNDGNGNDAGHVRVFDLSEESTWIQVASDLDGEGSFDYFGYSVSLSSDGNRLAVGATGNDGPNGFDAGHVRVFELECVE